MQREFVFPLIVGVILGALVMIFWQFNARQSNQFAAMQQLDQATSQNTQTLASVVSFLNNATGANKAAATPTTGATK